MHKRALDTFWEVGTFHPTKTPQFGVTITCYLEEIMAKDKKPKATPFNVQADLRNDGKTLMVLVQLDGVTPKPSKNGKLLLFGATPWPVRLNHPRIPGLQLSIKVGQRLSAEPPELVSMREQQRALKAKIKAFQAARKEAKSKK